MRNVVITGGASGIGKSVARKFLNMGDRVFITDWDKNSLSMVCEELSALLGQDRVYSQSADVSKWQDVQGLAEWVNHYGGCDVLVNSAGVYRVGPLHEASMDDFDFQFDVNVRGIFNTCKFLIPQMLLKGKGSVVNVASVSGTGGDYNMPLYCATKGAVLSMTRAMAMDYSVKGVRINAISPSAVKTPMFLNGCNEDVLESFRKNMPDRQLCEPEQCANVIGFLASDDADHLCGVNIPVDGGLSAWNGQPNQEK